MSEPKLISPLLDSFAMGSAIRTHDGVSCYPAMKDGSDNRYIVKVITVPASQRQLDALLLSGAYPDSNAANAYFKDLVRDIVNEAEVLRRLSKLEGFTPYERFQVVPMDQGVGFQVYLLAEYRQSLEKFFQRRPMTYLGAVNLGIDLCAAMALCRQAGCMYVDLKPSNIYITPDGRYRIGDLGFIPRSSLAYASLPDKYRSSWTAPEIKDAYSRLNETIDIYAIGLVLYQAYNNGALPFTGDAPDEVLPPPMYADYEMSEIILRACAPDPKDRWQTPEEMGQALISYMQRNGANDTPIVPPVVPEATPEPVQEAETQQAEAAAEEPETAVPAEEAESCENTEAVPAEETAEEEPEAVTDDTVAVILPVMEDQPEEAAAEDADDAAEAPACTDEAQDAPEEETEAQPETADAVTAEDASDEVPQVQPIHEELAFIADLVADETAPNEIDDADLEGAVLSEETSSILAQADDLISHETPGPVVAQEPIDIPMPEPIKLEPEEDPAEDGDQASPAEDAASDEEAEPEDSAEAELSEADMEKAARSKRLCKRLIAWTAGLLVAAALLAGGYYYYQNYYLQPVNSMAVTGKDNQITVEVKSPVKDLTVICTNAYGDVKQAKLKDGKAVFEDLAPDSHYTVQLKIEGFHQLTGQTSGAYTTPPQTKVVSFVATAGPEDGSVILNFTVDGSESKVWNVIYGAEDEEEKTAAFASHTATINGLTVGKEYTFRIEPEDPLWLTGETELTFTACELILAENPKVESCNDDALVISWTAPADTEIKEWTVHCYNEKGGDLTVTTAEPKAELKGVDTTVANTVEITASGMTKSARLVISANPVSVSNVSIFNSAPGQLTLQWDHSGKAPEGGWVVNWTMDGSDLKFTAPAPENSLVVDKVLPETVYHFSIETTDGSSVFNGAFDTKSTEAVAFEGFGAHADKMQFSMCRTPDTADWSRYDLSDEDVKTAFAAGEKASFLIYLAEEYEVDSTEVTAMFVTRDDSGKVIDLQTSSRPWVDMWYEGYCELDIPSMPSEAGSYSLDIYFNGMFVTTQTFTVE